MVITLHNQVLSFERLWVLTYTCSVKLIVWIAVIKYTDIVLRSNIMLLNKRKTLLNKTQEKILIAHSSDDTETK